jgi:hypothetical protein
MAIPGLTIVAEGEEPGGERWCLKAGGSAEDYWTLMETVHPDGHRDEGGMGGPALYPGRLLNVYTGRADRGLLRVIVRADPKSSGCASNRRWASGATSCSTPKTPLLA